MSVEGGIGSFMQGLASGAKARNDADQRDALLKLQQQQQDAAAQTASGAASGQPGTTASAPLPMLVGAPMPASVSSTDGSTPAAGAGGATPTAPVDSSSSLAAYQPALDQAAKKYGLSASYLPKIIGIESSGDPNANNPSGAAGLLQFMPATAKQYGLSNPYDPVASIDAGGRFAADNQKSLASSLGRNPTDGELYLAHQQGATGAANLLSNPDASAVSIVGRNAVLQNGGTPDMTAGQFAQKWTRRLDGPLASVTPKSIGDSGAAQKKSSGVMGFMESQFPQERSIFTS